MGCAMNTKLTASFTPIADVTPQDIDEMHALFATYYDNADPAVFVRDMRRKDGVVIAREVKTRRIVGFSTAKRVNFLVGGQKAVGIFSGDTILEEQYWGDRSLHAGFFRFMVKTKLRHPLQPVYWLAISKGYKTYLVLANNFPRYYPHHERGDEELKSIADHYCEQLFPEAFDRERGLLDFGDEYQHLKSNVAEITDSMRQNHPKIAFFERRNPSWQAGTELPCVGVVSFEFFARFIAKTVSRAASRGRAVAPVGWTARRVR